MSAAESPKLDRLAPDLARALAGVCRAVAAAGGRAWLVGGSVRDAALGLEVRDLDLEVFGLAPDALTAVLARDHELDLVGRSFGILKVAGLPLDVGLPRREARTGPGHRDFAIAADPDLPLPAAAARRDFTLNAMYLDPLNDEFRDPWDGLADLRARRLRHTSPAFTEDPLRVLRGMQLCARFELTAAPETLALCRGLDPGKLAPERIFAEWEKLLLLGVRPSAGLEFLRGSGWLAHYPELAALAGVPQDPRWHPEGDVWVHTGLCLDAFAAERTGDREEDLVVGLAVLCHDFGKPDTTTSEGERIRALGHEQAGLPLVRAFLARMTDSRRLLEQVLPLVAEHMRPLQLFDAEASDAAVRRLAVRVGRIDRLVRVARADALGRGPASRAGFPAGDWLLKEAARLEVTAAAPAPLIQGRHLIALGQEPGPGFAGILAACYEAQLAGRIDDEASGLAFARRLLAAGG